MKWDKKYFFIPLLLLVLPSLAQDSCEIQQRISPDGTKYYSSRARRFFWSVEKQLRGGIVTDGENYYLSLRPKPFPKRPAGSKLKDDLRLVLSNQQEYVLTQYDTRYMDEDTILLMSFMIGKKQLEDFLKYDIEQVAIVMSKGEPPTIYNFKLHKSAVREQLACFIDQRKRKLIN